MSTATKPRNLKVTDIGPSKTVFSLMVRVQHTTAPTILIKAKNYFKLNCETVDSRTHKTVEKTYAKMLPGEVVVLVASKFTELYYVCVTTTSYASCTCGHYQNKKWCNHQIQAMATNYLRSERLNKKIAAEFVNASAAIEEIAPLAEECEELLDEDSKLEKWTEQELNVPVVSPECPVIGDIRIEAGVYGGYRAYKFVGGLSPWEDLMGYSSKDVDYVFPTYAKGLDLISKELPGEGQGPWVYRAMQVVAPETPTTCLQERLQVASDDERRAIWTQVAKDERIRNKEAAVQYWASAHALQQAAR